jgi:diguanylate cyclase (GGDEF)-like protein
MPAQPYHRPGRPTGVWPQRLALTLVGLVTLVLVALDGWHLWVARDEALRLAQVSTSNLARALAQHAEDSVGRADALLVGVVERIENDGFEAQPSVRLRALLQNQQRVSTPLAGLFVYDETGNWRVTSNAVDPIRVNNADREYFRYHRDNPERSLHLGPAIQSRTTHEWVLPLSRRLNNADGSFAGVALATLKLSAFNEFYDSFVLDTASVIVLTLRDGTIVTRRPYDTNALGSSLSRVKIFTDLLPVAPAGTRMGHSLIDGMERLYAYRQVDHYPLVVMTSMPRTAIYAQWQEDLLRSFAYMGIVLLAMALCGLIALRRIRDSQHAEAELRNAHAALHKLAMQDSLTGLANRHQLDAALPEEIGRARRSARPLALIMLEVDHFKRFNELYGVMAGDACIKSVGQAVLRCVGRAGDLVVRYDAEELLVLLPDCDSRGAAQVADKILQTVRGLQIHHAGNNARVVTVSIGVHVMRGEEPAACAQDLIDAAEQSLRLAKSQGRNRVVGVKLVPREPRVQN